MRTIIAFVVSALFSAPLFAQTSQPSPGLSLARLKPEQCSYAVAIITKVTRDIRLFEEQKYTKETTAGLPARPQGELDKFVLTEVENLVSIGMLRILTGSMESIAALTSAKEAVALEQMRFAYVLELRGCPLTRESVQFIK